MLFSLEKAKESVLKTDRRSRVSKKSDVQGHPKFNVQTFKRGRIQKTKSHKYS